MVYFLAVLAVMFFFEITSAKANHNDKRTYMLCFIFLVTGIVALTLIPQLI